MPVSANPSTAAGDLTFSALKTYATDQLADRTDTKGVRRVERIVNQAISRLAGERNWAWYLQRHRLLFRPRERYTGIDMSAEGNTITLTSGTGTSQFRTDAAQWTWYFSGDTELLRIKTRDNSTQLTTFDTDVYVASADLTGASGFLVRNRYQLPSNFKCIAEDLHQKDFFSQDSEIGRGEMLHLNQTYTPSSGSPINYVVDRNPITNRWEIMVWQWPAELRSADLYIYIWPLKLENDADVLDWDPNQSAVVYSSINVQVIEELRLWKEHPEAMRTYRRDVKVAANADRKTLVSRVAGHSPARVKRMQLNRLFTDGS